MAAPAPNAASSALAGQAANLNAASAAWTAVAATAARAMPTNQSPVSGFDRPQSVLVAGPRPLEVVYDSTRPLLVHVTNFSQFPGGGGKGGTGAGAAPGKPPAPGSGFSLASVIGRTLAAPLAQVAAALPALNRLLAPLGGPLQLVGRALGAGAARAGRGVGRVGRALAGSRVGRAAGTVGRALAGTRVGRVAGRVGRAVRSAAGPAGGAALGALKAAGGMFLQVAQGAQAAGQAVLGVGQAMASFVAKANPAAINLFERAVEDLTAVVGKALAPAFGLVTQATRLMADALVPLAPVGTALAQAMKPVLSIFRLGADFFAQFVGQVGNVVSSLSPALQAVGVAVLSVAEAIKPLYEMFLDLASGVLSGAAKALSAVLTTVVPYISAFAKAVGGVIDWVGRGVRELLALIGIDLPHAKGVEPGSSVGAAARNAQFGEVGGALRRAQLSAFSLGTGATNPAVETASAAKALQLKADEIYNLLKEAPAKLAAELAKWAENRLKSGVQEARNLPGRAAGAVGDLVKWEYGAVRDAVKGSASFLYNNLPDVF